MAYLNEAGYYAKVVKGLEECMNVVDWYMKLNNFLKFSNFFKKICPETAGETAG